MPTMAISYRRSDTAAIAGRIFDRLTAHFGEQAVFMDIDSTPYGVDFRKHIRETLERTDVLIALIGAGWLGRMAADGVRMQEPTDPVRVEIETALERKMRIIPVLVDGAKMPDPATLPETFGDFVYFNAAEISSGRNFRSEMERLIGNIDQKPRRNFTFGAVSADGFGSLINMPSPPQWRLDGLRYFLVPLIVLLVAHYAIVNALDLSSDYLRLVSVAVPLAAGFALFWVGGRSAGPAIGFALALGLAGAAGMSLSESMYSGDPLLPQSRFEWLDNFQYAATMALSFVIGHLAARTARALLRRWAGSL